jgi:putative restriction endonuclease
MATEYFFGELVRNPVGTTYEDRKEAASAGVHRVTVQGISGNGTVGAESIVVSGGYEDDEDDGDSIIYTGAGGNDTGTGKQIADQSINQAGNAGLVISEENAYPVRVIRGHRGDAAYSPTSGYRYDGLYRVVRHWAETGKSGFRIWRFHFVRLTPQEAAPYTPSEHLPTGNSSPGRSLGVVQRIARSTQVADAVKKLHDYTCQICDEELFLPVGKYAEGAHIRALGTPHSGPDTPDNVLCLCPNHHTLFDLGALYLDEQLRVRNWKGDLIGVLSRKPTHPISTEHARYHRESFGYV